MIFISLQNAYYLRTQHNLDVVDAVVTAITKANLTSASDKILVASEDSSALAAIQNLVPSVKLVYNVPFNPTNPISVTLPVLQVSKSQLVANTNGRGGRGFYLRHIKHLNGLWSMFSFGDQCRAAGRSLVSRSASIEINISLIII